jgi:hypothetical protein
MGLKVSCRVIRGEKQDFQMDGGELFSPVIRGIERQE